MHSDRNLGKLLLAFFLALYLLTGGGHGYSPDGEFAYYFARAIFLDPQHDYIKKMRRGLDQWGFTIPLLAQPLVVPTAPLAKLMPEKDRATVDGRSYLLGIFRTRDAPNNTPTVGPRGSGDGVVDTYVRTDLQGGPATSLAIISWLALSKGIPQGATVAELTLVGASGEQVVLPLRAGVETAEWSIPRPTDEVKHQMARVASVWAGNTRGRNYFVELPLGRVMEPRALRLHYLYGEGHLYVRTLALLNRQTGSFQEIPSDFRFWSERENEDLFARFFYTPFNAIVTAIGCLLLFALARLLGYGQLVAVVATLIYGLATLTWPYSKYDFSEPTLVMFILASLYFVLRWGQERRDRLLLYAGIASFAAVGTKYASGVLIPLLLLQVALLHWERYPSPKKLLELFRPLLLFVAPFLLVAAPALGYFGRQFGYSPSILEAWAGIQRGWLPLPFLIGLRGLLFSPGKSFFLYSPPTLLAFLSAVPFLRRHRTRAVGLLLIILVYFTIYSKKAAWHAGAGWGPRYQVLVIPLVILILAPLIQKAIEERHRWARYALLTTFVLGVGVQLLGVSKSFDYYLGTFRFQVYPQLPDEGAQYGGGDYYPYASGLDNGNDITATLWAWPFSPILAHAWLLATDFLAVGPSFLQPWKDKLLGMPPWRLWGIDVLPPHPEYGLGFDFWSMKMRTDFPSSPLFLAGVFLVVLLLEAVVVVAGARLNSFLFGHSPRRATAVKIWTIASILALLVFDGIHLVI